MFSQAKRLSKSRDVASVSRKGRAFFSPHLLIKFLQNRKINSRATVVVSTKVSKRAVVRNRLKRIAREALKAEWPKLKHGDWLVIVRPAAAKLERKEWRKQVDEALVSANRKLSYQSQNRPQSYKPLPKPTPKP